MLTTQRQRYTLGFPILPPIPHESRPTPTDAEFWNPEVFHRTALPVITAARAHAATFMGVGGLGGTWYSLHKLFEALEVAGVGKRLMAMVGHERGSQREVGQFTHVDWIDAIANDVRTAQSRRIFVGYSTSALAGLVAEALHPGLFRALVLVAPAMLLRKRSHQLGIRSLDLATARNPLLYDFFRSRSTRFGSEYTTGPVELLQSPRMRRVPVSSVIELSRLQRFARMRAAGVECPVLIIQGAQDRTVDPRGARMLSKILTRTDSKILLGQGGHSVLLDRGRNELIDQALRWLDHRGLLKCEERLDLPRG